MRRSIKKRKPWEPDYKYGSVELSRLINYVMIGGKKNTARAVVYDAMAALKEETKQDPLEVFQEAMKNVGPMMEVRSRRVGGANYQVPREVRPERRTQLALRWIVTAARSKSGRPMAMRLKDEILLASKNEGDAVKKRDDTHKMADANKAFAHFAW